MFITVSSKCKIYYLDLGKSSENRFPIIFLHGWGLEGRTFLPSLRRLSQNRRVISPDLPGFGQTKCNLDDYRPEEKITDLISDLGLEKVHLIGHSIGGGVCIRICDLIPEKVLSLMLIDSSGIPFGSFENLISRRLLKLSEQFVVQALLSPMYNLLFLKSMAYNLLFNRKSIFHALVMPIHDDIFSIAQQIEQKTMIIWGEKDRTTPLEMGFTLSQYIPKSDLEVMCGPYYHEWSVLYPRKFAAIINDFINRIERGIG